jgi:SAM-dependent methyltransferase
MEATMEVNATILDIEAAKQHYDQLYDQGYMEGAEPVTVNALRKIFKVCPFPQEGTALDYGCGSGAYTGFLKEMLPRWKIYGADISETALTKAKNKFPDVSFIMVDSLHEKKGCFDLVFSRHVLEHVQDIEETFTLFDIICKERALLFHNLPCGNPGSLEHAICSMRDGGIDAARDNRFFYEDPTHLRRMTTDDASRLAGRIGFELSDQWYGNHHYAALDWLAKSDRELRAEIFDAKKVRRLPDKFFLLKYRILTELLVLAKKFVAVCETPAVSLRAIFIKPILRFSIGAVAKRFVSWFDAKVEVERGAQMKKKNGSEMFLLFSRPSSAGVPAIPPHGV